MTKRVLTANSAPPAQGPYSVAVEAQGLVFLSGQIALDPSSGEMVGETAAEQTHQVMANLGAILDDVGLSFAEVVKTTIYLDDIDDFGDVNRVYGSFFDGAHPARATLEVGSIPLGGLVEIELVAARPD
jgi:2-iminobutanoate/2-iminopropanoate deaminase